MNKFTVLIFISLFLASCATAPDTSLKSFKGKIPDDSGIVIAEIYNSDRFIPGSATGWNEIVLIDIDSEKQELYTIKKLEGLHSRSRYAGVIPMGRYAIAKLAYAKYTDSVSTNVKVSLPQAMGIFEIKAQGVTNLGTIIYHSMETKHYFDTTVSNYVVSREKNDNLYQQIKTSYPEIFSRLDPNLKPAGWNPDNFSAARTQLKEMILASDLPMHFLKSNKNYYLLTKYGDVLTFDNGDWKRININTHAQINQLVYVDNSSLLIEDEFNQLYQINTEKSQSAPRKVNLDSVIALKRVADIPVIVTHSPNNNVKLYSFENGDVTLITEYNYHQFPSKVENDNPVVYFDTNTVSINVDKNLIRYDLKKSKWDVSLSSSYYKIYRLDNDYLVASEASSWTAYKNISFSQSNGVNWTNTPIDGNYDVYIDKDQTLFYLEKAHQLTFGSPPKVLDQVPFYSTKDNGLNLHTVSTLPRMCDDFLADQSDNNNFFVLCTNGNVYNSRNKGKNWDLFYERKPLDLKKIPQVLYTNIEHQ